MKNAFVLMMLMFAIAAYSQPVNSHGKIIVNVQAAAKSAENVTVQLLHSKDSSLLKAALTDKSGEAAFENIAYGDYLLRVSAVSFREQYSGVFTLSEAVRVMPAIHMEVAEKQLQGVTVTAKKPFIQKLTDRIVVNVENSIVSAGNSAIDVLERSPGVTVDQNDVIALKGKQGVIIMIDGKPSPLSGADLANYLRGLPSSAIERIEIITNPSAKYDAAGNAGIIDIRMKKDKRLGTNGTLTAGYGQGIYPKDNAGLTFNYRNKKVNVFGNYNYSTRQLLNNLILDRNFYDQNGMFTGGDLKDNYAKMIFNSHSTRFGVDFFPNKKTIVGFVVNGNFNSFTRDGSNQSIVIDNQHKNASTFKTFSTNDDHNNNAVFNINLKHSFDSAGRELTADVDYGVYQSGSLNTSATKYYKLDGSSLQPDYVLNGDQDGTLTFKTGKADYTHPLKGDAKFEAGFKTSIVSSDNDAKFWDVSSGSPQNDVNKTNRFYYEENNNAGYLNFSKQFKKFNMQFGLRGEHTAIKTRQVKGNVAFDSSYFQLFPSAYLNYKITENQTVGLSVSRRIDRPGYQQLNPFLFLIDVSTYATGAPGLLPQITWAYELNYTIKNINLAMSYSHTTDVQNIAIVKFRDAFPNIPSDDNVTVQIPINLSSSDYIGLSVSAPVRINSWWNMVNNADIYYNKFNGKLGATSLNNGSPAATLRVNNSFTFKKGWSAELNGNVSSGGRYGFMVSDPQWGIAAGVQKLVLKNKGTVRLNVSDIFWTNLPKAVITYNNYIEKWHAYRDSRVANISFTYRFGNNKVQAARRRTTASEEERQRAGN